MTPHTEKLIEKVVKSFTAKQKADAHAANCTEVYRADLIAALATRERGIQAELTRRLGRSRDSLRLDADEAARQKRIADRAKKPTLLDVSRDPKVHPRDETGMYLKPVNRTRKKAKAT